MTTKGTGSFWLPERGKTGRVYVPADVVKDSTFPLVEGPVEIEIVGDDLVIRGKK